MSMIDSPTSALVRLALDAASMRHLTLSNNIANVDSPGYAPQRVNFEDQLAQVRALLASGRSAGTADFASVQPFVEQGAPRGSAAATQMLDQEMTKVAQNTLHYQALLRASSRYGSILSTAINEGKR
jgi:flagellar basal-body rod protein FlgB